MRALCWETPHPAALTRVHLLPQGEKVGSGRLRRGLARFEREFAFAYANVDGVAVVDLASEKLSRQRILKGLLDDALERPRAIGGVVTLGGEPIAGGFAYRDRDLPLTEELL